MSTEYFSNFPTVEYNGDTLVNICLRVGIKDVVKRNTAQFLPYNLQYEDETQETIAYDYYIDVNLDWLVEAANDVVDPYYDWKLPELALDNVIAANYGSIANAQSTNIFSQRITSNTDPYNVMVNANTPVSNIEYTTVNAYMYLHLLNQKKNTVYVINSQYTDTLKNDLKVLLSNAT